MSKFSTKGLDTTERSPVSRYLNYGISLAKINTITVEKAKSTDSKRLVFHLEGPVISDKSFEGVDGAKGCVGKMRSNFVNSEKSYLDLMRQIGVISDKLGVRSSTDAIDAPSFEDFIAQACTFISGKFLWWNIGAEEYDEGKCSLHLNRFEFVKALSEIDPETLKFEGYICTEARNPAGMIVLKFNKDNKFQFSPFVKSTPSFVLPGAAAFAYTVPEGRPNPILDMDDLPFGPDGENQPF